jgi:hypothetical protein
VRGKTIVPIATTLACLWTAAAAQEKPGGAAVVVPGNDLTLEQFQALPLDTVIEINGEQITKSDFQARNTKALAEAVKQLRDSRALAQAAFDARRKALLDQRKAAIAEANKKAEAEIAKLVAADAAAHGPNWAARKKQAADLFEKAAKATPTERSDLLKQAADLLAPAAK